MPPLYVGKAMNLRSRCFQHLDGNSSDFSERYVKYAEDSKLNARLVSDLILACVRMDGDVSSVANSEHLVEEILKAAARPPYGIR